MGDTLPLVSIIIPTHNRAAMLREAMASVAAQIYSHWELLVVDDRSTDETESLVRGIAARDPRVRYLRSSGPGMGATRNTAIVTARGSISLFWMTTTCGSRINWKSRWHFWSVIRK